MVSMYFAQGHDVNESLADGENALHLASSCGQLSVVKRLVRRHPSLNLDCRVELVRAQVDMAPLVDLGMENGRDVGLDAPLCFGGAIPPWPRRECRSTRCGAVFVDEHVERRTESPPSIWPLSMVPTMSCGCCCLMARSSTGRSCTTSSPKFAWGCPFKNRRGNVRDGDV